MRYLAAVSGQDLVIRYKFICPYMVISTGRLILGIQLNSYLKPCLMFLSKLCLMSGVGSYTIPRRG